MMRKDAENVKENSPRLWRIPPIAAEDHKYTRGHVLVLGGDVLTGAAKLASVSALRAGAGVVTLACLDKAWPVYAASLTSVIAKPIADVQGWQELLETRRINVALIGPGAGVNDLTRESIAASASAQKTLVLDADALTVLAQDENTRKAVKGLPVVCSPHQGEYKRLATALRLDTSVERTAQARALAEALGAVVALKGNRTIIAAPDGRTVVNRNAPPTLATAGSGDVLSGLIAGFAAQKMELFDAACAAVWIHAECANRLGRGLIAEDLVKMIPPVLQHVAT